MMRFRAGWRSLWQVIRSLWQRIAGESVTRRRAIGIAGALVLLLLASGLVFAAMAPASTPKQQLVAQAQPTATDTATATATVSPTVTATATAKPKSKPAPKMPPPPPLPTPKPPSTSGSSSIFSQFCATPTPAPPTPTATSAPTATSTSAPTSTTAAPTATSTIGVTPTGLLVGGATAATQGHAGMAMPAGCLTCPYTAGNNPSQSQISSALASAAKTYGLPVNLLKAVAWQESHWHEDAYSCDGGIGLMQIQYYVYSWLDQVSVPDCNIYATSDDPYTLQGNANLGAKLLKYLSCYYSYWGGYDYDANGNPHSLSNPSKWTVDWYYQQAGLPYPDSSKPNSLCAAVFNANIYYPDLPSTTSDPWSCPYSATVGDTTLLDITISAYNEGAGNIAKYGINNMWYVNGVEGYIPQFSSGALPVPS